jgi:prepilin signal peptidase PulO-like enzyme (type II secretory pathway)
MKLNVDKTKVITFSRKTNNLICGYKLFYSTMPRTQSVKDLGVHLDSKVHFHDHVNFIFSHCIKMLGLICSVTYNYSSLSWVYCFGNFWPSGSSFLFYYLVCEAIGTAATPGLLCSLG